MREANAPPTRFSVDGLSRDASENAPFRMVPRIDDYLLKFNPGSPGPVSNNLKLKPPLSFSVTFPFIESPSLFCFSTSVLPSSVYVPSMVFDRLPGRPSRRMLRPP